MATADWQASHDPPHLHTHICCLGHGDGGLVMTARTPFATPLEQNNAEMRAALFSLSQTQRRNAHQYKKWALEAEADGKPEAYKKYHKEYVRSWGEAKWHLNRVRIYNA